MDTCDVACAPTAWSNDRGGFIVSCTSSKITRKWDVKYSTVGDRRCMERMINDGGAGE